MMRPLPHFSPVEVVLKTVTGLAAPSVINPRNRRSCSAIQAGLSNGADRGDRQVTGFWQRVPICVQKISSCGVEIHLIV